LITWDGYFVLICALFFVLFGVFFISEMQAAFTAEVVVMSSECSAGILAIFANF